MLSQSLRSFGSALFFRRTKFENLFRFVSRSNLDFNSIEEVYGNDTKTMLEALVKIDGVKEKTNNDIESW